MKKILCALSALAVLIISGCSSAPSEAPLFEKYAAESTAYPVKFVFKESDNSSSTYYMASSEKWYVSYDSEETNIATLLHDGNVAYSILHDEKTAFATTMSEESKTESKLEIGLFPVNPEKWVLTEKGEAQFDGKTYLYETAVLDDTYFLTVYADTETNSIEYVSRGQGGDMCKLTELTHSFDLRIFEIPEDYEIVNIPSMD